MYLEHYGLREAPFRITPHTDFFFAGGNRGATLEALIYAISNDEGIVKVTGEVGSGKTMLCRMLLEKLPATVETVYLANPSYSRDEILHALAAELQLELPEGRPSLLLKALQERLLQSYAAGRRVVVLIDEAHAMPGETLEEIRLLSNLESSRHKLLQIVLFGQPELDERLAQQDLRQLKERITHNFGLEPLRRTDIGPYLMFRLRAAGYHGPDIFSPRALQDIDTASEGLTRRINILADKAMLAAFAANTHLVDQPQVQAAVKDAQFAPLPAASKASPLHPMLLALPLGLALTVGAYWAGRQSVAADATPPVAAAVPIAQTPVTTPSQAAPEAATAPVATPAPPGAESVPAETPTATSVAPLPADLPPNTGSLTRQALAAYQAWLPQADDRHYVLQLLAVRGSATREVEAFLAQTARDLPPGTLRAYYRTAAEGPRWGVTYGDFPDRSSAVTALAALPEAIRNTRPYPRQVQRLR
jgi:type II secretory pathway predicted ATPase ExeA